MARRILEPLRFERHYVEKVWGGRRLEAILGIQLPGTGPIGETWEIVDRENENSIVATGEHAGRTLRELMGEFGQDILGKVAPMADGRFPLLVKYIDACQDLSVQVHPDDACAARLGAGAEGKTEAWFILEATPDARLYAGVKPDVPAERYRVDAAGRPGLEDLGHWAARPGECLLIPGGTVHAIGAGVSLLEVQQNSNTTYRIWDWGRVGLDGKPRETHLPQALECVRYGEPPRPPVSPIFVPAGEKVSLAHLARSAYFGMNSLVLEGAARFATGGQFQIYAVIEGKGRLETTRTGVDWPLVRGDVWLVPASAGFHWIHPEGGPLRLVQMLSDP